MYFWEHNNKSVNIDIMAISKNICMIGISLEQCSSWTSYIGLYCISDTKYDLFFQGMLSLLIVIIGNTASAGLIIIK